jgi:hypothetical protein
MTDTPMPNPIEPIADRIPGDRHYAAAMWRGDLDLPPCTTRRALWDWKQAHLIGDIRRQLRMVLPQVRLIMEVLGPDNPRWMAMTLPQILADLELKERRPRDEGR